MHGKGFRFSLKNLLKQEWFMLMKTTCSVLHCADLQNVPETFCMLSGLQDKTVIKLRDSRHRSWPVSFHRYPQFAQLRKGWEEFCEGNNLKEGDKCFFRLVSKKEMHVRIVRN